MGLAGRPVDGDSRTAGADDLRRHVRVHLVAAGADRRPHPGGPFLGAPLHPFQGDLDDAAHDPAPPRVDGREAAGPGDEHGDAVRGDHRKREPLLLRNQGVPLAAEPGAGRQGGRRVDLLRPGERRRPRRDRPQDRLALLVGALGPATGEAHLDVAMARLPHPVTGFVDGAVKEGEARCGGARHGGILV